MFTAALTSLSWRVPQPLQVHSPSYKISNFHIGLRMDISDYTHILYYDLIPSDEKTLSLLKELKINTFPIKGLCTIITTNEDLEFEYAETDTNISEDMSIEFIDDEKFTLYIEDITHHEKEHPGFEMNISMETILKQIDFEEVM